MRIIVKGKLVPKAFQGKCRTCGTVAEWHENELRDEYDQQERKGWKSAQCPVCHEQVHNLREAL